MALIACLFIASTSFAQKPKVPDENVVRLIFNESLGQKLLFFKPRKLPYEVERTHKKLVRSMEKWVNLDLIIKKKTRFLAEKIMYGEPRMVSVGGFEFSLNQDNPWVSEQGFFYGRANMKDLFELSAVSFIADEYYCEAYVSWTVVDMPDWLPKVNLKERQNRLLKRAFESHKRPFEKRIHLIYREKKWQLWDEKGEQTLF